MNRPTCLKKKEGGRFGPKWKIVIEGERSCLNFISVSKLPEFLKRVAENQTGNSFDGEVMVETVFFQ